MIQGLDRDVALKDGVEETGDIKEVVKPLDPATKMWGPIVECWKTSNTDRRAEEEDPRTEVCESQPKD